MSLYHLLSKRAAEKKPVRIGMIGAGRYGAMFLAQAKYIPGMQIVGVADLNLEKAQKAIVRSGWSEDMLKKVGNTGQINDSAQRGAIALTDDAESLIHADLDVVIEVTGTVDAASRHIWAALGDGKHVVNVSAEADALLGLALQKRAEEKGVVYSYGFGDEPAELCEQIDWAKTSGFEVVCIGKYIEYTPEKRYVNPGNVWEYKKTYTKEQIESGDVNAKMFSSFLDGTKTLTETCCAANAYKLLPPSGGMKFPTIEFDDLVHSLKPKSAGGILQHSGTIEVPSNFHPDGTPVKNHLRWGVFITVKALSDYACSVLLDFQKEKRMIVDSSGEYGFTYRPTHILGLELGHSVASVAVAGLPTGCPTSFMADMVSVAKKDLKPGDMLDGPGAYALYGDLVPAKDSLVKGYLPTGLTENVKVIRPVSKDSIITYDDVELDETMFSYKMRKDIENGKYGKWL